MILRVRVWISTPCSSTRPRKASSGSPSFRGSARREGFVAGGYDGQLHEPRFRRRCDERDCLRQRIGSNVLQQRENQTVGKVRRHLDAVRLNFLLTIVRVPDRDLAAGSIDRHIERLRKSRPPLEQVVGDQAEALALRIDGMNVRLLAVQALTCNGRGGPIARPSVRFRLW
jgi:hypothetical protein